MAVTISLHSCTSSKKISVLPGTSFSPTSAESRSRKSLLSVAVSNSCRAAVFSKKFSSTKFGKASCPCWRIRVVLPTCRAPVTSSALCVLLCKKTCIFFAAVRCNVLLLLFSMPDAPLEKSFCPFFQMYYTSFCPFTQHICLFFCPVFVYSYRKWGDIMSS